MARTFVDQPTQVFHSDNYDDTFAPGVGLQTGSFDLEDDLNALRSQVRKILWADVSGSWYDTILGVANLTPARGLITLNSAVTNLEFQKFVYDVQSLGYVQIATGSNFVGLSVSGSTAPSGLAAVGLGTVTGSFTGSLVATLPVSGAVGVAHSLNMISGTSPILPRNMTIIRDAYTHETILDYSHGTALEIYGLLQVQSGTVDGDAFNDNNHKTQISFVVEYPSGVFAAADTNAIGGKIINYQYRARTTYSNLPEDAYANTVFVDIPNLQSITLQQAINNQGATTVQQTNDININLNPGFHWSFLSGTTALWTLYAGPPGSNTLQINVNDFRVSSSFPAEFSKGIKVDLSGNEIDVGVIPGTINTPTGSSMILQAGNQLFFADGYDTFSTYSGSLPLANGVFEWNNFATDFGAFTSILGAFHILSQSASGSMRRRRANAGVTTNLNANVNVTFPTNLDAALLSYVGRSFVDDLNIYLNGILLLPGTTSSNSNDVYPGTSAATGDLKFPYKVRSGSQIAVERYTGLSA